jgi:ABC-type dipeptide/oligopeptide/nickel transport system permease component
MIGAVAVIVANLIADLAYAALDPRVDLRGGRS